MDYKNRRHATREGTTRHVFLAELMTGRRELLYTIILQLQRTLLCFAHSIKGIEHGLREQRLHHFAKSFAIYLGKEHRGTFFSLLSPWRVLGGLAC